MSRGPDQDAADVERVEALRRGDENAFQALVEELQPGLRRMVRIYVDDASVAEEVIQETWLGVIRGIFSFEGRSSLKTWIFRILANRAKTRAIREKRTVPFSDLGSGDLADPDAPASSEGFSPADPPARAGRGMEPVQDLRQTPDQVLLGEEAKRRLAAAIDELPTNLRIVLMLRDVEGWTSEEVCNVLAIRETNQRVLLHRARSRLRLRLQPYFKGITSE